MHTTLICVYLHMRTHSMRMHVHVSMRMCTRIKCACTHVYASVWTLSDTGQSTCGPSACESSRSCTFSKRLLRVGSSAHRRMVLCVLCVLSVTFLFPSQLYFVCMHTGLCVLMWVHAFFRVCMNAPHAYVNTHTHTHTHKHTQSFCPIIHERKSSIGSIHD